MAVTSMSLVSVYLPTRNRAAQLERAVRSVLRQDYTSLELLVVDDASTDETPQLLERLAREDSRVRVLRSPAPAGASVARNLALREARGQLATGLDDDDVMLPGRITSLVHAHRSEYAFVCSARYVVDLGEGWFKVDFAEPSVIDLDGILSGNVVGNQVLVETERVRAVGMYDESLPGWQDYDLWTRLVMRYGPGLRVTDSSYVVVANSSATTISNSPGAIVGARRYLERYGHLMSDQHRRSHGLVLAAVEKRKLSLREASELWSPATRLGVLRYLARTSVPGGARWHAAFRRMRGPLNRLPAPVAEALGARLR
jgi:glycosyltransferase involved in cell wall biosynthesis